MACTPSGNFDHWDGISQDKSDKAGLLGNLSWKGVSYPKNLSFKIWANNLRVWLLSRAGIRESWQLDYLVRQACLGTARVSGVAADVFRPLPPEPVITAVKLPCIGYGGFFLHLVDGFDAAFGPLERRSRSDKTVDINALNRQDFVSLCPLSESKSPSR